MAWRTSIPIFALTALAASCMRGALTAAEDDAPRSPSSTTTASTPAQPTASTTTSVPKCFPRTEHDFGVVARGGILQIEFPIHNVLDQDLHLSGVRSTCGCARATLPRPTLAPGETASIVARLDTQSLIGPRTGTITVLVDKPHAAEIQLLLKGVVRTDVDMSPGVVDFGSIDQDVAAERRMTLRHLSNAAWKITDARPSTDRLEAIHRSSTVDGRAICELVVRLRAAGPAGYLREQIVLTTSDPQMPRVVVNVEGRVEPPVSVSPELLFLGTLEPGQTVKRTLVVKGVRPFRIRSIQCERPGFEFTIPPDAQKLHMIPLRFTPAAAGEATASGPAGAWNAVIEIVTDDPRAPTVRCQVASSPGP